MESVMSDVEDKHLANTMTWDDICTLEPKLRLLESDIRALAKRAEGTTFCANRWWYGRYGEVSFKERLVELVGWESTNPKFTSPYMYDRVLDYLYNLLPDCTHDDDIACG